MFFGYLSWCDIMSRALKDFLFYVYHSVALDIKKEKWITIDTISKR
jgi:hypothetical protein